MKFKFSLVFFLIIFVLILLPNSSYNPKVLADCTVGIGHTYATGLVTADSGSFASTGACIISGDVVISTLNINDYASLKTAYYDKANTTYAVKHPPLTDPSYTQNDIHFNDTIGGAVANSLYYITGNLNIGGNNAGTNTGIVFVDGDLNINKDYCYNGSGSAGPCNVSGGAIGTTTGTVFIVKGNVNIDQNVTRIDAAIISGCPATNITGCTAAGGGRIYTATDNTTTPVTLCTSSNIPTLNTLVINGSLISLDPDPLKNIVFCRTLLSDNTNKAAEIINLQVKYLVILRNILSQTVQTWTEVVPTPAPAAH